MSYYRRGRASCESILSHGQGADREQAVVEQSAYAGIYLFTAEQGLLAPEYVMCMPPYGGGGIVAEKSYRC